MCRPLWKSITISMSPCYKNAMAPKTIRIACQGHTTLDIDKLEAFQGDLKDLSKDNYNKLRKQILELGFSEPVSVWQQGGHNYLLNGHQRHRVLTEMRRAEKYTVPPIPVNLIDAENEHEAKKKILSLTSQFGEITSQGLFEFASLNNIDLPTIEDFRFPEIDMDKWKAEFFEDISGTEMPELNTPENKLLTQMTFTVSEQQKEIIISAMGKASGIEHDELCSINENGNGNKLYLILKEFLNG